MIKDDFNNKEGISKQHDSLKSQQFNLNGFSIPPIPGGTFPEGTGMNIQPPTSAPPRYMPDMPRTGEQPFSGEQFSTERFGGGGRDQSRNLRRCLNNFTFIWLINGNSFWFYPIAIGRQQVEGFRWRQGRWVYDRINLRRILFFRCS